MYKAKIIDTIDRETFVSVDFREWTEARNFLVQEMERWMEDGDQLCWTRLPNPNHKDEIHICEIVDKITGNIVDFKGVIKQLT